MADVYRAEVYYQVNDGTVPTATNYSAFADAPELAVTFVARDQTSSNSAWFSIVVGQQWISGTPAKYRSYAEFRFGTAYAADDKTYGGTLLASVNVGAGDGGAAFLVGGTLVIEKDQAADEIRFTSPAGSHTHSLSALSMQNANAMYGEDLYALQWVKQALAGTTVVIDAFWRAFWTSKNGIHERGASLASVQPGVWTDATWAYVTGENIAPKTHFQQVSEDEIQLFWEDTRGIGRTRVNRHWSGGNTIALFERELDMDTAREHGVVWRVFGYSATPDTLRLQASYDKGSNWTETIIHSGETLIPNQPAIVRSPNVAWYGGKLYVVWQDGENIVQAESHDYGHTWSSPVAIVLKSHSDRPEWPRFIVHRSHGLAFYFYRSFGTGDLLLRRSGDFGITFTDVVPIHVFAGTDSEPFDAAVGADGYVRVRFQSGGLLNSYVSVDYGLSWTAYEVNNILPQHGLRQVDDLKSGLSYHVYWYGAATRIKAYASPNYGVLPTPGGDFPDVETDAVSQQTPDIEILPDGGALVSYFSTIEALLSARSYDFARTWN